MVVVVCFSLVKHAPNHVLLKSFQHPPGELNVVKRS